MIHPRLGMAMRRAIKRSRVIIPGHAKVGRRALPYCSRPSLGSELLRSPRVNLRCNAASLSAKNDPKHLKTGPKETPQVTEETWMLRLLAKWF